VATTLTNTGVQFPDATIQTTAAGGGGFSNLTVFTSSGTWTVPAGITKCKVTVVGGGDVAIDVARTALRLGSEKVNVICLETNDEMPAHKEYIGQGQPCHWDISLKKFWVSIDNIFLMSRSLAPHCSSPWISKEGTEMNTGILSLIV